MEMKDFLEKLKACKLTTKYTSFFGVKVSSSISGLNKKIYTNTPCKTCGRDSLIEVVVEFHKPLRLTVFQAEMLYAVFALSRKPADYASYHKCQAGKEFIENIKSIRRAV